MKNLRMEKIRYNNENISQKHAFIRESGRFIYNYRILSDNKSDFILIFLFLFFVFLLLFTQLSKMVRSVWGTETSNFQPINNYLKLLLSFSLAPLSRDWPLLAFLSLVLTNQMSAAYI